MIRLILWWLFDQPDDNLETDAWISYHSSMSAWVLVLVLVFTGVIVFIYRQKAYGMVIRDPDDLFKPYRPIHYLLGLSFLPGLISGVVAWLSYTQRFSDSTISFVGQATEIGIWCAVLTVLLSYVTILVPGFTPPKFKYRPVKPFLRKL